MRFLSGWNCKLEAVITAFILVNAIKWWRNEILKGVCVKK